MSTEIPYWWRVTTQIWVVLLIGWSKFHKRHDQSETLPRSGQWHVISMEFLCSFLRQHFAGKPMVALQNIVCFLRLQFTLPTIPGKGWCSSSFSRCTLSLGSAWSIRRFWSVHWKDTFTLKLQCNIYMNTSFSRPKKVDCKFIDICDSKLSCQTLTSS